MRLVELQNKNVIDISSGRNVGSIIDIKIDEVNGNVLAVILESRGRGKGFFNKEEAEEVAWSNIVKIGTDVILIKI